jgi:hypothetical protein
MRLSPRTLVWLFLGISSALAQSSGTTPPTDNPPAPSGTSKDRLFFALPNFLTLENAGHVPPLSSAQKFKAVARGTFDPVEFFWWGALSGIGQWENSEPGYGQGAEGYGKRYGANICTRTPVIFRKAREDSGSEPRTQLGASS